eukprot:CAMPEP_0201592512 /NCGR_PEP_ID=MMETSP0190_2-20130828/190385_1 /ASSEMBLY_ACC=CAM_ASM_000263 /TAXON_ID=37353 /ORGANISM="Rosalina sp." /LENGTH=552 /DNA_ID=CAMNT_0048051317 /DNA_START=154 /DNA_END=1812 /DNA_ORIENTATION=-
MGEHNSTHFYINLFVTGDHWFGFAFPDDCTPNSGCTGELTPAGCSLPNAALSGCKMDRSDAIIFGGELKLSTLEWTLNDDSYGYLHAAQNTESVVYSEKIGSFDIYHSVYITRPYDPSKYGDRFSHKITYPFAGSFCWLWAMGDGLEVSPTSNHLFAGYQCIDFGGDTEAPTPSPSYGPTPGPTTDPTPKPTKMPSSAGETGHPTMDPTKEPSISPTEISSNPSVTPTRTPTPGPTQIKGEPSNAPTKKPTPTPTDKPSVSPTPEPTDAPLQPGQTKSPSTDPSLSPTTYEPTSGPTYKPTPTPTFCDDCGGLIDMDPPKSDTSWLQENLTWILTIGVIAAITCFCGACFCFWCMQNRRTEKRKERRQNLLQVERFKYEQGLNIDAENRSKRNRAISKRMAAKNKRNALRKTSGSGSHSGSRFGYGDGNGSSTTESDEFFMDEDLEYGHGRYRARDGINDNDEKAEIYVTPGGNQGGMGDIGGRKKKYKPIGRGRGRGKNGVERKSKFVAMGMDDNKANTVSISRPRKKYKPITRRVMGSDSGSGSDLDSSD